jgi:hypothetical protein
MIMVRSGWCGPRPGGGSECLAAVAFVAAAAFLMTPAADRTAYAQEEGQATAQEQGKPDKKPQQDPKNKKDTTAQPANPAQKKAAPAPTAGAASKKNGDSGNAETRQGAQAPLRFDDGDLLKYHGRAAPTAGSELPGSEAAGATPGPTGPPVRSAQPASSSPPRRSSTRTPPPVAPPSSEDPLKVFKERAAQEKSRADQIQTVRDRITSIQARIEYLKQKRLAILDPFRIMPQGSTSDDRTKDAGLGARELLAAVDEEIKSQETALAETQAQLAGVETQFDAGSPKR